MEWFRLEVPWIQKMCSNIVLFACIFVSNYPQLSAFSLFNLYCPTLQFKTIFLECKVSYDANWSYMEYGLSSKKFISED